MRAQKITFSLSEKYIKDQHRVETFLKAGPAAALHQLYIAFWGTPVFVLEIKEIYIP